MSAARSTSHAQLRYLQRVDPTEPYPEEKIREMIQRGKKIEHPNITKATPIHDAKTGIVAVFDEYANEVVTLFANSEEELQEGQR